jgi:hypothetical protein
MADPLRDETSIDSYVHVPLDAWRPDVPGRIERIYTHWSANDYAHVFPAYHFCVAVTPDTGIVVVSTHDVRENMRRVDELPHRPYAQHTSKRNSFALGLSVMAMLDATPHDFGAYPLTQALIDGLCVVGGRLATFYGVPIDADHVMSHAEAALRDGYFGTKDHERWDIARLHPSPRPLEPREAIDVGDELRERMRRAAGRRMA